MTRREEQSHLELFRTMVTDFPEGVIDKDGERPDWVVHSPSGRVGIEHTRFHQFAPPLVAREVARDRVMHLAQAEASTRGCPPLAVFAQFRADADIAQFGMNVLASAIANAVMSNIPDVGGHIKVQRPPAPLLYLAVIRRQGLTRSYWQSDKVGIVTYDFSARLNGILDSKHKQYHKYLKRCDSCWLVVVAEGDSPSSFVEMDGPTIHKVFRFSFARCFFVEMVTRRMFELRRAETT